MSPRSKASYKLVPASVPARGARATMYDNIVADFMAMKDGSVRVEVAGRKPASVRLSLKNAIDRQGAKAKVVSRGDETYLVRI